MRGLIRVAAGLVFAALVLGGCGGADDEPGSAPDQDASPTDAAGSPAETEPPARDDDAAGGGGASGFCADIEAVQADVGAAFEGPALDDPTAAADSLEQAVAVMRGLEPPAQIAGDWAQLVDVLEAVASASADVDLTDPEAASEQLEELGRLMVEESGELEQASANIEDFLAQECGISVG